MKDFCLLATDEFFYTSYYIVFQICGYCFLNSYDVFFHILPTFELKWDAEIYFILFGFSIIVLGRALRLVQSRMGAGRRRRSVFC